mmetsp:Transcript_29413/g.83761  ORF Transcript_29413/g.83761 Transcript_29413/m.83761 type:complete len:213 (+) Transcript_29413:601-1239(+)
MCGSKQRMLARFAAASGVAPLRMKSSATVLDGIAAEAIGIKSGHSAGGTRTWPEVGWITFASRETNVRRCASVPPRTKTILPSGILSSVSLRCRMSHRGPMPQRQALLTSNTTPLKTISSEGPASLSGQSASSDRRAYCSRVFCSGRRRSSDTRRIATAPFWKETMHSLTRRMYLPNLRKTCVRTTNSPVVNWASPSLDCSSRMAPQGRMMQ